MEQGPGPIDYVARWGAIVRARREQHDAVVAAQGQTTADYWERRAKDYHRFVRERASEEDPLVAAVRRHARPEDTVLDVGAGTGRHTIAIARHARKVIAVDPSQAMLGFLREQITSERLTNVEICEGAWPDVAGQVPRADIVISAHVLYPIEDVVPFLRALDGHARRLCFLQLMVLQPWFDRLGLWEAVQGEPRRPQPTYIDALNVLHQRGCYPSVDVSWIEAPRTFDGLDDAVERFAETVAVGDDPERRRRLRQALEKRLERRDEGGYELSFGRYPMATLWWEAGALA